MSKVYLCGIIPPDPTGFFPVFGQDHHFLHLSSEPKPFDIDFIMGHSRIYSNEFGKTNGRIGKIAVRFG